MWHSEVGEWASEVDGTTNGGCELTWFIDKTHKGQP